MYEDESGTTLGMRSFGVHNRPGKTNGSFEGGCRLLIRGAQDIGPVQLWNIIEPCLKSGI